MILEAERHGCVREVMVIAAALSLQDPRERPADEQQARPTSSTPASADPGVGLPHLAQPVAATCSEQQRELSGSAVPPDVPARVPQLPAGPRVAGRRRPAAPGLPATLGIDAQQPAADAGRVHQALLAGLLSQIGLLSPTSGEPAQAAPTPAASPRGVPRRPRRPVRDLPRLGAVPGSSPAGPDGRRARRDLPAVGPAVTPRSSPSGPSRSAPHLVKRTYSEPHWDARGRAR